MAILIFSTEYVSIITPCAFAGAPGMGNVASARRATISRDMTDTPTPTPHSKETETPAAGTTKADVKPADVKLPKEIGGPAGPEPTRYGDWEQKGRCTDF
jgi:hypothetical protein